METYIRIGDAKHDWPTARIQSLDGIVRDALKLAKIHKGARIEYVKENRIIFMCTLYG